MSYAFYVWYRVERNDRDTEAAIRGMLARLACRSGIPGRLLKKRSEPGLWMEVHEGVADPEAFARLMAQAVDEYDIGMFIDGARHEECFQETPGVAPSCAARTA